MHRHRHGDPVAALVDAGGDKLRVKGQVRRGLQVHGQGHGKAPAVEQGDARQAARGDLHCHAAVKGLLQALQHLHPQGVQCRGVRVDGQGRPGFVTLYDDEGLLFLQRLGHRLVYAGEHVAPGGLLGQLLRDGAQAPLGKGQPPCQQGSRKGQQNFSPSPPSSSPAAQPQPMYRPAHGLTSTFHPTRGGMFRCGTGISVP